MKINKNKNGCFVYVCLQCPEKQVKRCDAPGYAPRRRKKKKKKEWTEDRRNPKEKQKKVEKLNLQARPSRCLRWTFFQGFQSTLQLPYPPPEHLVLSFDDIKFGLVIGSFFASGHGCTCLSEVRLRHGASVRIDRWTAPIGLAVGIL